MSKEKEKKAPLPKVRETQSVWGAKQFFAASCALILVVVAIYGVVINGAFLWDDTNLVVRNPDITSLSKGHLKNIFTNDLLYFRTKTNFYRPLQTLSYALDYRFYGKDARGYHLTNIVLHAANALLIFRILVLLNLNPLSGFFAALLFAVHPVHTAAVAYISGRADELALFFLLVSFLFILVRQKAWRWTALAGAFVAFALATLSKEVTFVFPLALFVFCRFFGKNAADAEREVKGNVMRAAWALTAWSAIYAGLRMTVLKFAPLASQAVNPPPFWERLPGAVFSFVSYIRILIFPYDVKLDRPSLIPPGLAGLSIVALITAGAAVYFYRRRLRSFFLLFGFAWFCIFLIPNLNIIIPLNALVADHWLYLPFLGVSIAFAYGIGRLFTKVRAGIFRITVAFLSMAILAYGVTAFSIAGSWRTEKALFSRMLRMNSREPRTIVNLGVQLIGEGKHEEAIAEFKKALEIDKSYHVAYLNTAIAELGLKKYDAAQRSFGEAVRLSPEPLVTRLAFAKALYAVGRYDDAVKIAEEVIDSDGRSLAAYNMLGVAYAKMGKGEMAREVWNRALSIDPGAKEIAANIQILDGIKRTRKTDEILARAELLAREKRYAEAIKECKEAVDGDPSNIAAHNNLGVLYGVAGQDEEAVGEFKRVLELAPHELGACLNLGLIYERRPETRLVAIAYFERFVAGTPAGEMRDAVQKKIDALRR